MLDIAVIVGLFERARTVPDLRSAIEALLRDAGFPSAYFITPVTLDRRFGRVLSIYALPASWAENYTEKWQLNDPLPDIAIQLAKAFRWSDAGKYASITEAEQAFLDDLAGQGFADGIAVPCWGSGGRAGFVGVSGQGVSHVTDEDIVTVQTILQMSFLRYCELIYPTHVDDPKLSQRELDVLSWISRGKSNAVIGEILGISRETVDSYVRRIFAKLGVSDRTSAVTIAALKGYVYSGKYRKKPEAATATASTAVHTGKPSADK